MTLSRRCMLLAAAAIAALAATRVPALAQAKEVTFAHQDMIVPLRVLMARGEIEKATGYKITWKMFGGGGDGFKNYMTTNWHLAHDSSYVHYGGMNYPYGEHVLFTDNQPLFSAGLQ